MRRFLHSMFEFDRPETRAEVVMARLIELFVVIATLNYAWKWGATMSGLQDVVLPLGVANYVDFSLLLGTSFGYINAGLITVLVGLSLTRVWSAGYLVSVVLLHVQYVGRYSLGEIAHSSNTLGMTLLAFALALFAFQREDLRRRMGMGLTYFFLGLGYTSAAFCKLVGTGPDWVDGRHLWMWIYEKSIDMYARTGVFELTFLQEFALDHVWIATAFLTIGFLTELFAFVMWWPRFRFVAVSAVIGLHFGIYLTMEIVFQVTTIELFLLLAYPLARYVQVSVPEQVLQWLYGGRSSSQTTSEAV